MVAGALVLALLDWAIGVVLSTLVFFSISMGYLLAKEGGRAVRFFLGGFLAAGLMYASGCGSGPYYFRRFVASTWRDVDHWNYGEVRSPRHRMVDDLLVRGVLDGMTAAEILKLLGPPAGKGFPHGAADSDIHYRLGIESGILGVDSDWLLIYLDQDGVFAYARIYTD